MHINLVLFGIKVVIFRLSNFMYNIGMDSTYNNIQGSKYTVHTIIFRGQSTHRTYNNIQGSKYTVHTIIFMGQSTHSTYNNIQGSKYTQYVQ